MNIIIAGCSGFYGKILTNFLLAKNYKIMGIDINKCNVIHKNFQFIKANLTKKESYEFYIKKFKANVLINLATIIDLSNKKNSFILNNNIKSNDNLIELANKYKIKRYIYTSSNSVYLGVEDTKISDNTNVCPVDSYGLSKVISEENILKNYKYSFSILRCPNILGHGRIGIFSIIFDLIKNNSIIFLIDQGKYKYQSISPIDLNRAIYILLHKNNNKIYNIGSNKIITIKQMIEYVIKKSNSKSKIKNIPKFPTILLLKILHKLRLSPIGPYQFKMLTNDFYYINMEIMKDLSWVGKISNDQMLYSAYRSYLCAEKHSDSNNGKPIEKGILKILNLFK